MMDIVLFGPVRAGAFFELPEYIFVDAKASRSINFIAHVRIQDMRGMRPIFDLWKLRTTCSLLKSG